MTVRKDLFSLAGIEARLDDLRLTEDVVELRREVDALLKVAHAAREYRVQVLSAGDDDERSAAEELDLALSRFEP